MQKHQGRQLKKQKASFNKETVILHNKTGRLQKPKRQAGANQRTNEEQKYKNKTNDALGTQGAKQNLRPGMQKTQD